MSKIYDVAVIGAGVIGGMTARELSKYSLSVCMLEKGNDVASGASKANSGIIHGGYDPVPGTLKAQMNVSGVEKLYAAADELNVPYKRNGSMVCAFGEDEEKILEALYDRGKINGVNLMKLISGDEARALEPALSKQITKVLLVTNAGIICPYALTIASVGNAMDNGVQLMTCFEVSGIKREKCAYSVFSKDGKKLRCRYIVNCAGAGSDKIAEMCGNKTFKIIPRAGGYMLLDKEVGNTVSHTIFQVPTKDGKGILVTPTADGNLLTGPTAYEVPSYDCTETRADDLETVEQLAKKSVPTADFSKVITSFVGVRASEKNGDFIIKADEKKKCIIHAAAIDSPGLTSCVAIAEYVVSLLKKAGLELIEKENFCGKRKDVHFFSKMSDDEKDAYIKEHPEYGKIICRCEQISEGEIRDALRMNPPANDVDGVKRRTRSGMGRCGGGFCLPYVIKLISEEKGIPRELVSKCGKGSEYLAGKL